MLQPPSSHDPDAPDGAGAREAAKAKAAEALLGLDPSLRAGEKLAQARAHLGLSLEHVADRLRVRRDYLEALETMNIKVLPGRAYTLAYLRSYAKHLGLDDAAIVAQFQRESALTREDVNPQLRNPESKPRRERPWMAALVIALLAAGFVGWRAYSDLAGDPRVVRAAPADRDVAAVAPPPVVEEPASDPTLGRVVVELRALKPAWLEVRGPDGTIFFTRQLDVGEGYRPDVGAGWTIHARDGGAFELFVDGVSRGPLGDEGSPVLGRRVDAIATSAPPVSAAPATPAAG